MGLSGIDGKDTTRAGTILAPFDQVDRLAESSAVTVWKRRHLRVIENRAEGSA
jgi:hypothetical protein